MNLLSLIGCHHLEQKSCVLAPDWVGVVRWATSHKTFVFCSFQCYRFAMRPTIRVIK